MFFFHSIGWYSGALSRVLLYHRVRHLIYDLW